MLKMFCSTTIEKFQLKIYLNGGCAKITKSDICPFIIFAQPRIYGIWSSNFAH
jgi:hypothetical protein